MYLGHLDIIILGVSKLYKLILAFLISFSISASEWKIKKQNGLYFLEKSNEHSFQVINEAGTPEFIEEKELGDFFKIILYDAGSPGTSVNVTIKRALVFNKITLRYLGDYPYEYVGYPIQPRWTVKGKKLTIKDEETGLSKEISID